ncbi:MAG: hypothetical protein MJY62_04650, partial [Bacteroidales bacterium]|nr:hypothetical protein [Bacteroidales bacterium]
SSAPGILASEERWGVFLLFRTLRSLPSAVSPPQSPLRSLLSAVSLRCLLSAASPPQSSPPQSPLRNLPSAVSPPLPPLRTVPGVSFRGTG